MSQLERKRRRDDEGGVIRTTFGLATNKRRLFSMTAPSVTRQFGAVYRKLKMSAPLHMMDALNGTHFGAQVTSTPFAYDCHTDISQGDAYNQRFGTVTRTARIKVTLLLIPGTTQASPETVRFSLVRGQVGSTGAQLVSNLNVSAMPIANNRVTQLFADRRVLVAPTSATAAYPTKIFLNIPFKKGFRVNYTGSGTGTNTGETIFLVGQSPIAAGTACPVIASGNIEIWFQP